MKLLFAFTSVSIKGLTEFIALTENMASAWVLLSPNNRQLLSMLVPISQKLALGVIFIILLCCQQTFMLLSSKLDKD